MERDQVKQACTVLYDELPPLDSAGLQEELRLTVEDAVVEWAAPSRSGLPVTAGIARFGRHRIAMIALDAPVKEEVLARTVAVSPMPEEMRTGMLEHEAAIRLLYVGDEPEPVEQMAALYRVAGALMQESGLGVLNERATLAQPPDLVEEYLSELDQGFIPLPLWVGAVTFAGEGTGSKSYLMRTYGMEQFRQPELAMYFGDQAGADEVYNTLLNIGLYLVENSSRLQIEPGHTAEFKRRTYLFTLPETEAPELEGPTGLLVLVEV
ncbi:MAG: DUF4261 domain-containing protein [Chloroflexia bacterium]